MNNFNSLSRHLLGSLTGLTLLAATGSTQSAIVLTAIEDGADVVISGSGTIDLTELTFSGDGSGVGFLQANAGIMVGAGAEADYYLAAAGDGNFGTGTSEFIADSGTGDVFGVAVAGQVIVPDGYVSNASLSGSARWLGQSFASLGISPGTYSWTWGSDTPNFDSITLQIGGSSVPAPSSIALLLVGALALRLHRLQ